MAKLYASETAVRVADDCVQIHGGYGFVKDYPAEKYFRDVKLLTIGEGNRAGDLAHRRRVAGGGRSDPRDSPAHGARVPDRRHRTARSWEEHARRSADRRGAARG